MKRSSAARWLAFGVMALALSVPANAQRAGSGSAEAMLRQRLAAQRDRLQPHLDLANFYYSERRYDDLDQILNAALKLIRQAQKKAGADGMPPTVSADATPRRAEVEVQAPFRLREIRPAYPAEALEKGIGGVVGVEVTVDTRGVVTDARITQSVAGLDDAALAAARQWEFAPAILNNTIVPVIMDVRLTFLPEPIVRVPGSSRRQVSTLLTIARRHFEQGSPGISEAIVNAVLLAGQRERAETSTFVAAATSGVTSTNWPLRAGFDVKPPAKTRDVGVLFPPDLLQARASGIVTFEFVIDEQGKPTNIRQLGTSAPAFEQTVRDAVQQWEFAPTHVAGVAIPVRTSMTFAFQPERGIVEEVVRVGGPGEITEPKKIRNVPPVYPAAARNSRRQGMVVLEAVIGRDGKVGSLRIVQSAGPDLDQAAANAVIQWEFTPTRLYGVPVAVVMTVTVSFFAG
jgi:TonB family protein